MAVDWLPLLADVQKPSVCVGLFSRASHFCLRGWGTVSTPSSGHKSRLIPPHFACMSFFNYVHRVFSPLEEAGTYCATEGS